MKELKNREVKQLLSSRLVSDGPRIHLPAQLQNFFLPTIRLLRALGKSLHGSAAGNSSQIQKGYLAPVPPEGEGASAALSLQVLTMPCPYPHRPACSSGCFLVVVPSSCVFRLGHPLYALSSVLSRGRTRLCL